MDPHWELNRFLRKAFWHEMNCRLYMTHSNSRLNTHRTEITYLLW